MVSQLKTRTRANTKAEAVTRCPAGVAGRRVRREDIQRDEHQASDLGLGLGLGKGNSVPICTPEEVLRIHFESQFAPLEGQPRAGGVDGKGKIKRMTGLSDTDADSGDISCDDDQNYDGFSDISEEDTIPVTPEMVEDGPQVIDYTGSRFSASTILTMKPTADLKSFMSHKIPAPNLAPTTISSRNKRKADFGGDTSDAETTAANLKNDLALQRLLQESHLLDPLNSTTSSTFSLNPTGKNRHRAINSRTQALGGVDITKHKIPQPLKFRLSRAREVREKRREQRASEAGVILSKKIVSSEEKKKKEKEGRKRRQDRGFGPSVGKFRGGALVLSKRDVREIEGPRSKLSTVKGGKRR